MSSNNTSFAEVATPDPCSKCCDDDDLFLSCTLFQECVDVELSCVCFPAFPIFFSGLVILTHDAIANGSPRRHDITRDASFFGMWNSLQEFFCSGKVLLKFCRKVVLVCVKFLSVKDLDATSAILLASPLICTVVKGDVLLTC